MQADAVFVDAELGPGGDDVADDGEHCEAAAFDEPPQRAWSTSAFQRTIISAPFSLGSQPQKRPQESSAQRPPSTVPTKLKKIAKQSVP